MENPVIINRQQILKCYKTRANDAHKGTLGHALIIAGSYGKMGAAVLAAKSAMHSGCGLVTAYIPECGYDIVQTTIPEVMVVTDTHSKLITDIKIEIVAQAIGIGPGIGTHIETQQAFLTFLKHATMPLVLDADAINILSLRPEYIQHLSPNTILTPHPKELERLIGATADENERFERAVAFCKSHKVILVLKGATTHILDGDKIYDNTTGNPALATAGSGDVLTGLITGLCAQGYSSLYAALIGVYIHGLAADMALPQTGTEAFVASDIIANLGNAFKSLR